MFINDIQLSPIVFVSFVPFFLSYGFGQALTDCFQTDTDKLSAKYRPLSQGILSIKQVAVVSMIGLLICGSILIYLNIINIIPVLLSIIGLATYSYIKKNFWFLGPLYNAIVVSLLPLMGYLCFANTSSIDYQLITSIVFIVLVAYSIFVLMGYLKDIEADRATHYQTFPVVWGWYKTVYVSDFLYLIVFVSLFMNNLISGRGYFFYSIAILSALFGQYKGHFPKSSTETYAAFPIEQTVRSFILVTFTIIVGLDQTLIWLLIMGYIIFEIVLYFRPERNQI